MRIVLVCFFMWFLSACSPSYQEPVDNAVADVTLQMANLRVELQQGRLRNAVLLATYVAAVRNKKPELNEVLTVIAADATADGGPYRSLKRRFERVNKAPSNEKEANVALSELNALYLAADPEVFNDSLIDLINTVADLSDGAVSRMELPPKSASAQDLGAGSHLMGNPSYGQWQSNSSGGSFWEWYGKYAMFSHVLDRFSGPTRYNTWNRYREPSYYDSVGRDVYGSKRDRTLAQKNQKAKASKGRKKSFSAMKNRQYRSVYASGSGKSASQSKSAMRRSSGQRMKNKTASSRFGSHQFSSFRSSSRGSSAASRGVFRGK